MKKEKLTKRYADAEIINCIKDFYNEYGDKATYYKYKKLKRKPSVTNIVRRFGSWNNILREAGINQINEARARFMSDEEIIETVKEAMNTVQGKFNSVSYSKWAKENYKVSERTIQKRFGNWKNVLKRIEILDKN